MVYITREGETVSDTLNSAYDGEALDARGQYFEQTSVARSVALALLVSNMREAARLYSENREAAVTRLSAATARFEEDTNALAALDREDLTVEIKLAKDLLALMQEGAPQGTLYGN